MSTGAARLIEAFEAGRLVRPSSGRPNTVSLALALAGIAGAPRFEAETRVRDIASLIGEPEHLVFVLADGLGMELVERLPPDSFLRRRLALELDAVFPSSTAPALTSLATGIWPAAHAAPTWFTWLPALALTGVILPFVERVSGRALAGYGPVSEAIFPVTVLSRYFRRDFEAFFPEQIAGSVYSRYSTNGRGAVGYDRLETAVDRIGRRLRDASAPTYTYLYFPDVDGAEHEYGAASPQAYNQALRLDRELARLREGAGADARIVVSADHGLVTVREQAKHIFSDTDGLRPLLRVWPPAGEPRAVSFHIRPGRRSEFASAFDYRFGADFALLSSEEAESLRLFGPGILSPETRARIGDYVAIPLGDGALLYAGEPHVVAMKGMHGGLSPSEMQVPLVIA